VGGCPPPVIAPRLEPVCGCNLVKGNRFDSDMFP
jgi:hypothetical protein